MSGKLERGTVVEKISLLNLATGQTVYGLGLRCEDDAACEIAIVVDKNLYDAACVEGLGADTVIEYGHILRIVQVGPSKGPTDD